jgi:hypothetical protein
MFTTTISFADLLVFALIVVAVDLSLVAIIISMFRNSPFGTMMSLLSPRKSNVNPRCQNDSCEDGG